MSSNNPIVVVEPIADEELKIEVGKFAPQSSGSALLTYGETVILATAVMSKKPRQGIDFLPLVVDYEERLYAAGKISSSRFIKREGRPSEEAIITGRLVDRSTRPLFPQNLRNDIQIILTVLSVDAKNDPDIISLLAASTALSISNIPWKGPLGACRIGLINGEFVINPSYQAREKSSLDLVIAGDENKIIMIEAQGQEIPEEEIKRAIKFGQKYLKKTIDIQKQIIQKVAPQKQKLEIEKPNPQIIKGVEKFLTPQLEKILFTPKPERDYLLSELREKTKAHIQEKLKEEISEEELRRVEEIFEENIKKFIRKQLMAGKRLDGRRFNEIRPLETAVGILPRTHGSGFFQRGLTQILTIVTLGSTSAEQILESIEPETKKRYMHHYNFPPFSTGEVFPLRAPSRREIGHGALAEKALKPVIPKKEDFPYTIRVVSEVLSSNGSTSMASVCGSTLALMDAGVPIKKPVAGISIGLIQENEKFHLLTDITGLEDFCGDMDFKVAGTEKGITAIQLDLKIRGLDLEIITEALKEARRVREIIIKKITSTIPAPRKQLSPYAPRVEVIKINPDKIRDIIGPGGKTINKIIEETGVEIDIEPSGTIMVFSGDVGMMKKALEWISNLTREAKVGEIYQGKVTRITDFGAFVEIFPGQEGLVHISQISDKRIENIKDILKVGDIIPVMVIDIDKLGRINLSYKAAKNLPNKF